jgi:hypothetical protein
MMRRTLLLASMLWVCVAFVSVRAQVAVPPGAAQAPTIRAHMNLSLFSHSENCVACHNNLTAPSGADISMGSTWRSTMMANAGRDPYWQAGVRRETIDHPTHAAAIQDECAGCHMPMSTRVARAAGGQGEVFSHLPIAGDDGAPLDRLAADGVSCTVCHQISQERLGTRESFNGEFVLQPTPKDGNRVILGPYQIDAGRKTIMRSVTGFSQAQAPHVRQSELCATCHTLITQAIGPNGDVIGSLPEQMNYQEWLHSDYSSSARDARSCQSCHMPDVAGPVRISSVLGDNRERLSRHLFVGGNAFMVRLLNRYRAELGVAALPSELEATAAATVRQLQEETATVGVSIPQATAGRVSFDVDVRVLTGHKYPTGYPSRRTWLHVIVRDAQGRPVFESGAVDAAGAIAGNDNDADPARFEPHYDEITRADQVQIYEPILGDRTGRPTTGLLTATQYLKDNRLLPRGFDKTTADPQIGVYGDALRDDTFTAGGDRVRYDIEAAGPGPFTVDVELRYQPIGYRWAHNLDGYMAPEPQRFVRYFTSMAESSSVVVASASSRTGVSATN